MIERHLYLIFLEVMVFGGVIVFCLNRKTVKSVKSNIEYQSIDSTEPFAVNGVPRLDVSAIFHRKLTDSKLSKDDLFVSSSAGIPVYKPCMNMALLLFFTEKMLAFSLCFCRYIKRAKIFDHLVFQ